MIHQFKLNTDMEDVREKVMGLTSLWKFRLPDKPMYTLGASSYLDIEREDKTDYFNAVNVCNGALAYCFGALYREISDVLEAHLKTYITFDSSIALPGFHIFLAHEAFVTSGGLWHMDMGHVQLGLPDVDPISFTATVRLPKDGGGLQYKEDGKEFYQPYEVGGMILHDGCTMHKIAPFKKFYADDERITLQGHGVKIDGQYVLFW